jgi:hypothetical protein
LPSWLENFFPTCCPQRVNSYKFPCFMEPKDLLLHSQSSPQGPLATNISYISMHAVCSHLILPDLYTQIWGTYVLVRNRGHFKSYYHFVHHISGASAEALHYLVFSLLLLLLFFCWSIYCPHKFVHT